jgi:hypothetical protein
MKLTAEAKLRTEYTHPFHIRRQGRSLNFFCTLQFDGFICIVATSKNSFYFSFRGANSWTKKINSRSSSSSIAGAKSTPLPITNIYTYLKNSEPTNTNEEGYLTKGSKHIFNQAKSPFPSVHSITFHTNEPSLIIFL